MIEERLREAFQDRVELTPAGSDRADQIIRRTGRSRRWRRVGTSFAAVLAFASLLGGALGWKLLHTTHTGYNSSVLSADPTALPEPQVTASINPHDVASLGLDLRIGDLLWTTDGRRLDLGAHGDVDVVYRVPAGWLYGNASGGAYLQPVDGRSVEVAPEGSRWTVGDDGQRIAVVTDNQLAMADLTREGAKRVGIVNVPADTAPTAVLGDRVLATGKVSSGRGYEFVTVVGQSGWADPSWNPVVSGVLGTRSDAAVGLAWTTGEKELCLASLRPDSPVMSVTMTKLCGFESPGEGVTNNLSPDGGWLAEPAGDQLRLHNVDNALIGTPTAKVCAAAGVRSPIWVDNRTVVATYDDGVIRCQTDGTRKVLEVPASAGSNWNLVPRLGRAEG
ncbi:hypothetical protein SAMN05421812_11356 [Asanoa hainanensis]|uniref:Uncharacterized protein n=1 Tax=Asanoa hainanensis TaxID=560556 RepID=A0A239P2E2_9ACTN|nr:hypothetical protein [Asanoa hainanensis]SNT61291.1 hypothetical protein SAMN05421812_11356 [Asanoa hainanensis]